MVQVKILGTRGSVPVSGKEYNIFGGSTSAYAVTAAGETLFLDAGTGIRNVSSEMVRGDKLHLLLTHTHIDHLLGLPFFLLEHCRGKQVEIYGRTRRGETTELQLDHLFSLPLWPAPLRDYPGIGYDFYEVSESQEIGPFRVRSMESNHPGGALLYRVEAEGKVIVLATDFEHGDKPSADLAVFAEGADLLLYDAQYTEEEYISRKGFGHSTAEEGIKLMKRCGAKALCLVHHDPGKTDEELLLRERAAGPEKAHFAREGEVIVL